MKAFVFDLIGQVGLVVEEGPVVLFFSPLYCLVSTDDTATVGQGSGQVVVVVDYGETADSLRTKIQTAVRDAESDPGLPVVFILDSKGLL